MDEPLQKTLERYDVLDRIAVGGMAEVFLAKAYGAHGFEKTLAIKKILPELARDPEFEARFIAEAKVAVKLSHANVVQVFDFGRIGESLFIAMEYVDGLDLAGLQRKFKDEGRLIPLPAAFHIAIEIIRALDFAHQHGVVHRDVSPSNILISRAGEVKIGDFGIAVAASPHRARGPGVRKVMGKWRYMSPEQARGDLLDTRSDMFSAAAVLYELFTGDKLFPGDEAEEIIKNIETMPIPRASQLRNGLPSRLDEILAGPLSRKPIDRPVRPAVVLRSLIELSYESSIMATALDVAEAVSAVIPPPRPTGPGQHLDDVIRRQLGAAQEKSVARRTAVTSNKPASTSTLERGDISTGLFRKIDADGLARLEEVDPHGETASASRTSSAALDAGDSASRDARVDPDRRTEVGGPPTGAVPKQDPSASTSLSVATGGKSVSTTFTGGRNRGRAFAIAAIVVAGGGAAAGWYALRNHGETQIVAPVPGDARPEEEVGVLDVLSEPSGATVTITGDDGIAHDHGPTPMTLKVPPTTKLRVHVELAGYRASDDEVHIAAHEHVRVHPTLLKARGRLHVVTTPVGAQVVLGGLLLGETPLLRDDLELQKGAELVISHGGFESARVKVDLTPEAQAEVMQTLKAAQKMGTIRVSVQGGWGYVFFHNAKVGKTPMTELRLPVGTQKLHFENPGGAKWDAACEVSETETKTCTSKMP